MEVFGGNACQPVKSYYFRNSIPCIPRRKVWLRPAAGVPSSNAANMGEGKTWTQSEFCTWQNSVRGQEPPKMYI